MDLKVYALLNEKIKELAGGGLTRAEVEKIVTDEVAKIVAGAPEDFDTLKEMSDWILNHEESAASMNSAIQTNANDISALDTNKVDKVDGKSLVSDTEIARLAKVTNYDDSGIKADIQTNADNINTNKTNILTLKKHVTGELTDSDFSEDSTVAMTKTVPSGMGDYAAIKVIGGKTVKDEENQVLKNAVVESVVSFPQNIWNEKWEVGSIAADTGLNEDISTSIRSKEYTYIGNAKILYVNYKNIKSRFYSTNKTYIGYGTKDELNENAIIHVPDGAKYFRLSTQSNYGNTYKNDICISLGGSSYTPHTFDEITLLIPSEFKNLPGYGLGIDDTNYNIIDFENGTYHYNVEKYKLGNDSKVQMPETGLFFVYDFTSHGSALCNKYKFVDVNKIIDNKSALSFLNEGEFTYRHGSTNDRLYFKDSSIANAEEFITKNLDMEIVCTLPSSAKKIEPLANYIHPIRVETGGTIAFNNEHGLDMPNTVVYKKGVSLS